METKANKVVDHLFRHEYGKMVGVLTRIFGVTQIELTEDVVQDTFYRALNTWRFKGVPDNPQAWLMRVARNRAIDIIRHKNITDSHKNQLRQNEQDEDFDSYFYEGEVADNQLRLIFICCHPELKVQDQIAFTLKTVSGFGIKEIAKALISPRETIKKRLQRSREKIKKSNIHFEIPVGVDLKLRLKSALAVLYLLFNEGYNSSKQDELIRRDLCAEAMRLCKLLDEHPSIQSSEAKALMALMCYHAARFESRMTSNNEIILLDKQDRNKWNRNLIGIGNRYMNKSIDGDKYSVYHLEAAIAAEHCMAESFEQTNWENLLKLYEMLYHVKPGPVVILNKVVVYLQLNRISDAMELLSDIDSDSLLNSAHLYHAVAAEVFLRSGDHNSTFNHLTKALELAPTDAEEKLIRKKSKRWTHAELN